MPRLIAEGLAEHDFNRLKAASNIALRTESNAPTIHASGGRYEAWAMVGGGFVVFAHTPAVHYAAGLLYVYWLEEFPGSSRAVVAGCGSLSTGLMLLFSYFAGALQRKWQSQGLVVLAGAVMASAGLLATSYATQLWQLYLAFSCVVGIAHALTLAPCPVVVSRWFPSNTGAALGLATSGSGFGTIYLGLLVTAIVDRTGDWRLAVRVLAALTLFAIGVPGLYFRVPRGRHAVHDLTRMWQQATQHLLPCSRYKPTRSGIRAPEKSALTESGLREKQRHVGILNNQGTEVVGTTDAGAGDGARRQHQQHDKPYCSDSGGGGSGGSSGVGGGSITSMGDLLMHERMRWLCASYFLVGFAWEVPFVHLVRFALDEGMEDTSAKLLSTGIGAGGLGRIGFTLAADRLGRERVFSGVLFVMAVANAALPEIVPSVPGTMAYAVVVGAGTGTLVALVLPLAVRALEVQPHQQQRGQSPQAQQAHPAQCRGGCESGRNESGPGQLNERGMQNRRGGESNNTNSDTTALSSGLVYSMLAIGVSVGPVLVGLLFDITGSYASGFRAASVFCIAACVASCGLPGGFFLSPTN